MQVEKGACGGGGSVSRCFARRLNSVGRLTKGLVQFSRPEARLGSGSGLRKSRGCMQGKAVAQQYQDTNFPFDCEGRTYHLGTKKGEVANRILMVGCYSRAAKISKLLSPVEGEREVFEYGSKRLFSTFTGLFQGVPVSIVTSLMGTANMDFAVRESLAVVEGPVAIIRLGTCGVVQAPGMVGNLQVATKGAVSIRRNPDAFGDDRTIEPYSILQPVLPNQELSSLLVKHSKRGLGKENVSEVLNASADSFYSSQGRVGLFFDDRNETLVDGLISEFPDVVSLEMETFHLLDLARVSKGAIAASAACIALMERHTDNVMNMELLNDLELKAGNACLSALVEYQPMVKSYFSTPPAQ